jgi:hypothetical protein
MHRSRFRFHPAASSALALAALALPACGNDPVGEPPGEPVAPTGEQAQAAITDDGGSTPIANLPLIDAASNATLLGELLARPTTLGETTALQIKLPPPHNRELASSLVRVIGEVTAPHMVFRSDALARIGVIGKSPGPDFFTAFVTLSPDELAKIQRNEDQIASGAFGDTTRDSVLFSGRSAVARTNFPNIDPARFTIGNLIPINRCFLRPISTQKAWDQSLFITAPDVVLDHDRTWDPCTGNGTKGGVWTFAHLIREMANGSGKTPEDFVVDWLSLWLNSYTVNGDSVAARTAMFNQVIQPWATASGVVATLVTNPGNGIRSVSLTGPLDLDIAPYRLEAIVNRIDLGETSTGGGTYGSITGRPVTAGELRFIFGVVQPSPWGGGTEASCGRKHFTTIFEYGVPGTGCSRVVDWAQQWTHLQTFAGFTAGYLTQLQSMTESVVLHGSAPAKGNQNAIDQIRTNEIALGGVWELREFTLSDENPAAGTDTPSDGELRVHTVAQTPNEAAISPGGADPSVNSFVTGPVTAGLELPVSLPDHCNASFTVPFNVSGTPFRGGNALVAPPDFWRANSAPSTPNGICARHQFSLNTCHGCHRGDSGTTGLGGSTSFVHADPATSIPVKLSKFLTGGGPGLTFNVNDTQFPGMATWKFADLDRRLQRLFDLSHCTSCISIIGSTPKLIDVLSTIGPIPADIDPRDRPDLKIGPITDIATMQKALSIRGQVAGRARSEPADVLRTVQTQSH